MFSPQALAATRFMLAVGNDVGDAGDEPLRWAEADAERVFDVMVDLGGVTTHRARTVLGQGPADVEAALLVLQGQVAEARSRGDRTEIIFSYSGHGDRDALHLREARLPMTRLLSLIDGVGADASVVIIDACRSGVRAGRARGATVGPRFDVQLIDELAPSGRVVLASASDGEIAQESDDLEGAFFTHHLLAGLRGAADGDGDGAVDLAELYRYAHARTLQQSFSQGTVQHPELRTSLVGQGELVLTRLDRGASGLRLAPALMGRLLVADARSGRVLFEVDKRPGMALRLAVPSRRLQLLLRTGADTMIGEVDMQRGRDTTVDVADLTLAPRLAGRSRGSDIDVTPYGLRTGIAIMTPVTLTSAFKTPATAQTPKMSPPATGIVIMGERRIAESPFFVGIQLSAARAGGDVFGASDVVGGRDAVFTETALRAQVPLFAELWTPVGRLHGGLTAGVEGVFQEIQRTDAERLAAAGFDVPSTTHAQSLGPLFTAQLGAWVPIWQSVAVVVGVEGGASVHAIDGTVQPVPFGMVVAAIGVEL
jgi:hypothetical protein